MPEDDDMSEDKFEGYLDDDDLTAGGDNSHDPCDDDQDSSMNLLNRMMMLDVPPSQSLNNQLVVLRT